jgi:glycerophosphoryl diester phosphodiesterase
MDLLNEAIARAKGEDVDDAELDPEINLRIPAMIPDKYIPDIRMRLSYYKALAEIKFESDVEQIENELQDQFGPLPEPVVNLIEEAVQRRGWKYGDFLVSSFKWDELLHLKILKSPVRIGMLFTEVPENLIHILHIYEAYSVHFPKELITAELVAQMRVYKKQIYAFTVNELADIEKMKALKVNGVFTNFPDRV